MKGKKILIPVLLLITLIAVGVTIWALCFRDTAPVLAPDYAPVEEESNAQAIEDDSGEKLEAEEGGGAVSLTYSNEVTIDLSDKAASLVFANPGKSVQDMVVQIVIDDTVIVQSGTLKPGFFLILERRDSLSAYSSSSSRNSPSVEPVAPMYLS